MPFSAGSIQTDIGRRRDVCWRHVLTCTKHVPTCNRLLSSEITMYSLLINVCVDLTLNDQHLKGAMDLTSQNIDLLYIWVYYCSSSEYCSLFNWTLYFAVEYFTLSSICELSTSILSIMSVPCQRGTCFKFLMIYRPQKIMCHSLYSMKQ